MFLLLFHIPTYPQSCGFESRNKFLVYLKCSSSRENTEDQKRHMWDLNTVLLYSGRAKTAACVWLVPPLFYCTDVEEDMMMISLYFADFTVRNLLLMWVMNMQSSVSRVQSSIHPYLVTFPFMWKDWNYPSECQTSESSNDTVRHECCVAVMTWWKMCLWISQCHWICL